VERLVVVGCVRLGQGRAALPLHGGEGFRGARIGRKALHLFVGAVIPLLRGCSHTGTQAPCDLRSSFSDTFVVYAKVVVILRELNANRRCKRGSQVVGASRGRAGSLPAAPDPPRSGSWLAAAISSREKSAGRVAPGPE
jgi:hypothetical protein